MTALWALVIIITWITVAAGAIAIGKVSAYAAAVIATIVYGVIMYLTKDVSS